MDELGSLAEVESALRGEGFLAGRGKGLVADVYLGYGLSRELRRTNAPDPPEPCRLPAAAVEIRGADASPPASGAFEIGRWQRTWSEDEYGVAVEAVRTAIAAGDVYQVNLVQHLSAPFRGSPAGLAAALAPLAPAVPFRIHHNPQILRAWLPCPDGWRVCECRGSRLLGRRDSRRASR